MKKSILLLLIILTISHSFSSSIEEKVNNFFDKREKQIEKIYNNKEKQCHKKQNFYKQIIIKLFQIKKNPKYEKYKKILNDILKLTLQRYKNYKICKTQIKKEEQTIHKTNQQIKTYINNNSNPTLISQINKNYLSYLTKNDNGVKFEFSYNSQINLNPINKIEKIKNKFFLKVNGKWLTINGYSYFSDKVENFKLDISYIKKNRPGKIIFYINQGKKNKFFIVDKKNIIALSNFDLDKSIEENFKKYPYFKNFLYSKKERGIIVSGIAKKGNNLFFLALGGEGKFFKLNKSNIYLQVNNIKNPVIINEGNSILLWKTGMKYYYIGKYELYKNIDFKNLGKILQPSFFRIAKYNKTYSVKDMYQLLEFFNKWNNKKLKDYYLRITKNIKYNKKVNDILNTPGTTPENLDKKIKSNPSLIKNWIIFSSFKNKEGVCQTISDLLSLGALFNGQKAVIVLGYIKSRGYGHQVSKINSFYYDPTYDLYNNQPTFFGMNKKELEKYFKITNY